MEEVSPDRKFSQPSELRVFTGGGSRFQNGDVLFARITPCLENGKITRVRALSAAVGFGSTEFYVFRAKEGISDPDFVYYLARSRSVREPAIQSMVGASGRQRANADTVKNAEVLVPGVDVQRRIGEVLSRYDDLIECNRQTIHAMEEVAIRIFNEWFVRLRFPGHEQSRTQNGVPQGWTERPLPDIANIGPRTAVVRDREKLYVPMSGLHKTLSVISETEVRTSTSGSKFKQGDTLFARITPCIENGKTALVQILNEDEVGVGSTEFIVLRPKGVNPYWIYCLARSHHLRQTAINSMKGSDGRQRVNPECFNQYLVTCPPSHLLDMFENIAAPAFKASNNLMQQNKYLANARDGLFAGLMSGEIEV
jgi:type I restriction enzyme S subunit